MDLKQGIILLILAQIQYPQREVEEGASKLVYGLDVYRTIKNTTQFKFSITFNKAIHCRSSHKFQITLKYLEVLETN